MAPEIPRPLVDRLFELLQHLGLERAHVAAAVPGDWRGLAMARWRLYVLSPPMPGNSNCRQGASTSLWRKTSFTTSPIGVW